MPEPQSIQIPKAFDKETGGVCSMEWSSDGYVLAVGWENGWAIFSVGGRCLASGFGVDDIVEKEKSDHLFASYIPSSLTCLDFKTALCMAYRIL